MRRPVEEEAVMPVCCSHPVSGRQPRAMLLDESVEEDAASSVLYRHPAGLLGQVTRPQVHREDVVSVGSTHRSRERRVTRLLLYCTFHSPNSGTRDARDDAHAGTHAHTERRRTNDTDRLQVPHRLTSRAALRRSPPRSVAARTHPRHPPVTLPPRTAAMLDSWRRLVYLLARKK